MIGSPLSGNAVRLQAINNVEAYVPPAISFDPAEAPADLDGGTETDLPPALARDLAALGVL